MKPWTCTRKQTAIDARGSDDRASVCQPDHGCKRRRKNVLLKRPDGPVVADEAEARRTIQKYLKRRASAPKRLGVGYQMRAKFDPLHWTV